MDTLTLRTQRLVHIDLKGAPPKLCFFEKFFPFIKTIGATGILLEWEDTFPYIGELIPIGGLSNSAQTIGAPYSLEEARQLLELAMDADLTIIPLIQTFGHMEFVLKHEQWKGLREVENYPSSMCPSNSETIALVRSMVKQMVNFHQNLQYIHIGADEIWHLGVCPVCTKRLSTCKYGKANLYLDHLTEVAHFIKENYPNLKIIIWDDMLRHMELKVLQEYNLGNLVEPMVWHYNSSETFNLDGLCLWEKYSNIFPNIWAASAFKGATSSCQILPINKYHISNHEAWLNELAHHGNKILNFKGIALTGWSRYDHYATLCELLPCAIPSLSLCLKTWISGAYSVEIFHSIGKLLGYGESTTSNFGAPFKNPFLAELCFPGWQIFVGFEWFCNLRTRYRSIIESDQIQTWFNQWQVSNNYTNPMQIDTILPAIVSITNELNTLETFLKQNLEQIFHPHTIEELIGTLFKPIHDNLKEIQNNCDTQLALGCRIRGQRRLNLR